MTPSGHRPKRTSEEKNMSTIPVIETSALQAGDVLLSYGDGTISDIIRLIDGGHYSHGAVFDGTKIVEAGLRGVVPTPLEAEIKEQKYVDAYRFHSDQGDPLGSPGWPADPVTQRAQDYLNQGTTYANNQLYLVGVLILLKRTFTRVEKATLQAVLKEVFDLYKRIHDGGETKSVVCSELVYRSFYEAKPEHRYALTIRDTFGPLQAGPRPLDFPTPVASRAADYALDAEYQDMLTEFETLARQIHPAPLTANSVIAAEMVSPHDLERSPNLQLIGRLRKPTS
jgi:hypothetical protein